jgi:predicted CXXCH cytochrome family protein
VPRAGRFVTSLGALTAAMVAGCATLLGPQRPKVEFTPYPEAEVAGVKNPHDYLGKPLCQRCHEPSGGRLRQGPIELCNGCHAFHASNHPLGVAMTRPSGGLPLGEGGKVVCHTCHDPHALKAQRWGLRFAFNDLCLKCHAKH